MNHTKSKSSHSRLPGILAAALLLAAASAQSTALAQSVTPSPQASPAADENAEVVVLPEFAVSTSRVDDNMRAEETLGAMRINTLLVESPITVTVLTPEFMEAFMLNNENEQASFVAGGNAITEWQSGVAAVQLRGLGTNFYRNGFQRWGYNATVNVERIEYIKGPLAATFGRSSPGGVINYITKRAQRRPSYLFHVNAGSYGYQLAQMSATGPVAKNLFYRVDFEYRNTNGVQDFFYQRTYAASSSVTWQIAKNTVWMFDFEHKLQTLNRGHAGIVMRWDATPADPFISPVIGEDGQRMLVTVPVIGGRITTMPNFNILGPDNYIKRKISTFDTRFEHRFNSHLSLRVNGQYWDGQYEQLSWCLSIPPYRMSGANAGLFPNRRPFYADHNERCFAGQADMLATFKIGRTSHKLLFTVDASDDLNKLPDWQIPTAEWNDLPATARNLNPTNPDWSPCDPSLLTEKFRDRQTRYKDIGFLLSERMELLRGRVLCYASLRYDDFRARMDNAYDTRENGSLQRNVFNETYGIVGHIVPGKLVAFVNRSTSFTASTAVDYGTGELQDPITSRGIEIGARGEILKGSGNRGFYWAASVYTIDRRVPQLNPRYVDPDEMPEGDVIGGEKIPQYLNSGIERVNGVELELFGNLSPQISFSLTYTKLNAYVRDYPDEPAREGVRLLGVPETSISNTFRYRIAQGLFRGVSFGAAMRYNDGYFTRYGKGGSQVIGTDGLNNTGITGSLRLNYGPTSTIEEFVPSVTLFDAFVEYEFRTGKKFRHVLGVNVKNVTDAVWYNASCMRGLGRQIFARYRVHF